MAKNTKGSDDERVLLDMLADGPKLVIQFGDARTIRKLIAAGKVELCDHPTVKGPGGKPADALRLTASPA